MFSSLSRRKSTIFDMKGFEGLDKDLAMSPKKYGEICYILEGLWKILELLLEFSRLNDKTISPGRNREAIVNELVEGKIIQKPLFITDKEAVIANRNDLKITIHICLQLFARELPIFRAYRNRSAVCSIQCCHFHSSLIIWFLSSFSNYILSYIFPLVNNYLPISSGNIC